MSVFRDVDIEWQGRKWTVTPSNRLLRRIEGEGISLSHMITRVAKGEPPVSEVCYVMAELLQSAGAEVTEDEIYGEVMTALANGEERAFADMAVQIVEAISPQEMTGKKPGAPAGEKPRRKGKAKSSA